MIYKSKFLSTLHMTKLKANVVGEEQWKKMEKMPADLFHSMYGAVAVDAWRQCGNDGIKANARLDRIGFNMGGRLVEELCAKCPIISTVCGSTFREAGESIIKLLFKMYMNANVVIEPMDNDELIVSLPSNDEQLNAITKNVVLPDDARTSSFNYFQLYCGLMRGVLESLYWRTEVGMVNDQLKGDTNTQIRIKLISKLDEERPPNDDQ